MKRTVAALLTLLLLACAVVPALAQQSPIVSRNPVKIKAYDPRLDAQKSALQGAFVCCLLPHLRFVSRERETKSC